MFYLDTVQVPYQAEGWKRDGPMDAAYYVPPSDVAFVGPPVPGRFRREALKSKGRNMGDLTYNDFLEQLRDAVKATGNTLEMFDHASLPDPNAKQRAEAVRLTNELRSLADDLTHST